MLGLGGTDKMLTKKKISQRIARIMNLIVFTTFLITASFLYSQNKTYESILLMVSLALYMVFVKISNIEDRISEIG